MSIQIFKFVDDFAIANETKEEHVVSVVQILERLAERGYSLKAKKLKILPERHEFMGHISAPHGFARTEKGLEALRNMPIPNFTDAEKGRKQLPSFLGLASWRRRYIRGFSQVASPLNKLLEKDAKLEWTDDCQRAWDTIIEALATSKGVSHPNYDLPFHLRCDGSADGIGGYLFQKVPKEIKTKDGKTKTVYAEHVIEYFSRSLPKPIRNYDARRLELLVVPNAWNTSNPSSLGNK